MTDDTLEFPREPQTGHPNAWCYDWRSCPTCREVAARYYPTPEQRVAQFFGGSGDSYSSYRAMHDHPFLVMVAALAEAVEQVTTRPRR